MLEPGQRYAEQAFYIAELNKGSIVASNVDELVMSDNHPETNSISQKIRNLKFAIARLNIQIDAGQTRDKTAALFAEKNYFEIELARSSQLLEENSSYYKAKYTNRAPSLKDIQRLLTGRQAVLSYYIAKSKIYTFIITHNSFECLPATPMSELNRNIGSWLNQLRTIESGKKFRYLESGKLVYQQLVAKAKHRLPGHKEWIVIPDGIICQLPLESLPIGDNPIGMLEAVALSYEFSTRSMVQRSKGPGKQNYEVLSFAPFALASKSMHGTGWQQLPASLKEVEESAGPIYSGPDATRTNFLNQLNKFPVVHLATHALADVANPAGSFIAFYEGEVDTLETRIYLEELYGLRMDSTKLVIISACETGEGQIASGEGALSLSRGFAYAGAASSVSSLWNADDRSTAFILARFHHYLRKGYSKPGALQQARLDYIASSDIARTPNYWSNLIIIGDPSPLCTGRSKYFWLFIIAGIYILLAGAVITREVRKHRTK